MGEGFTEFPRIPARVSCVLAPFDESSALTVELKARNQRTNPKLTMLLWRASAERTEAAVQLTSAPNAPLEGRSDTKWP